MDDAQVLTAGGATTFDEDEAAARAAARDPEAFADIYEGHRLTVYRYLRSRTATAGPKCWRCWRRPSALWRRAADPWPCPRGPVYPRLFRQ